jgi:fibronectin type 3 domain-containing protein
MAIKNVFFNKPRFDFCSQSKQKHQPMNIHLHKVGVLFITLCLATSLRAQTLADLGPSAPTPGVNDISQLSTSGNTAWPDGINYFTDNNPPVGQTFTTGANAMRLTSVAIQTAGLNSGNGYGTPSSTPTYYLRLYLVSGGTATLLNTFSAPNPGFTDGDWLQWSGLNVSLAANQTYAFTFGIQPTGGGWAALAVSTTGYAGGEIAVVPTSGGAITTGGSHSYDAVFDLGLQAASTNAPIATPLPVPTYGWNLGNTLESTWGLPNWSAAVFNTAASAGFNAVRIPCAWDFNSTTNVSGGVTNYPINPAFMAQVKQAVDWAIADGMYVVMNDHWDDGWLENHIGSTVDPTINAKMKSYWTQIATAFAGYDNHLLFAGANEPNISSPQNMTTLMYYYQTFVNAVRATGGNNTNRWLVVQSVSDPTWLNTLPTDTVSNRIMVEYHQYTPSLFCFIHADQSWGNAIYYWGAAYHYSGDASRNATWGEEYDVDSYFQELSDLYVSKGIPVMIGEFGAWSASLTDPTKTAWNNASVYYWTKYVAESARAHGISPFFWSTPGNPFDWSSGAVVDSQRVSVLTGGATTPPPNGAPYAASGLTAASAGNGQVNLSWTAGSGATSYNLYRAAESGYESLAAPVATGITGTSYTDTGLNDGTTYYYQVAAVNGSGLSGFSPEVRATIPGVNPDPAQFNFEDDPQDWVAGGSPIAGVATSSAQHYAGNQSLAVNFNGASGGTAAIYVNNLNGSLAMLPGSTITFRVWIPSGSKVTTLQPFLTDFNWGWAGGWNQNLTASAWNTVTLTVPTTSVTPLLQLGIYFTTSAAWTGTCYVDSIAWDTPAPDFNLSANPGSLTVNGGSSGTSTITVTPLNGLNGVYTLSASGLPSGVTATFSPNPTVGTSVMTLTADSTVTAGTSNVTVTATSGLLSHSTSIALTLTANTAPVAPTGLGAAGGNGVVALNWTQSASPGITGNKVYRSATGSGGPYNLLANLAATTSYLDTTVAAGTTYYYSVSAVNPNGESGLSAYAGATTIPSAPTGLAATPGNAQVALSWNASIGAGSYNIKRATSSGGPYSTIASGAGATSYTDSTAANGTTYYYVVSAVNGSGESANSAAVSATPSAGGSVNPPTNLTATASKRKITLNWTQSTSANIQFNKMYRSSASGGPYTFLTQLSARTSYSDSVSSGTTYYYVVTAVNTSGVESAYSNQSSARAK